MIKGKGGHTPYTKPSHKKTNSNFATLANKQAHKVNHDSEKYSSNTSNNSNFSRDKNDNEKVAFKKELSKTNDDFMDGISSDNNTDNGFGFGSKVVRKIQEY